MKILSKSLCFFFFIVAINIECYSQKIVKDIQKRGELRVGMSGDQPPFAMLSREDQLIGYEVQLAELLAEAMGVELKIIEIPFSELLISLQERKVDVVMSGMTITTERNMKVAFVGPYILSGKSILTKSSTLAAVKNASDMNQAEVKLVALKGSTSESFVKKQIPNASLSVVANYNEAVSMLREGKTDALIADYPVCAYSVMRYPEDDFVTLNQPMTIEPIGIALPPDDPLLKNIVSNFFAQLQLTGILQQMEQQWFKTGSWLLQVK